MSDGRQRVEWARTAEILSLITNVNRNVDDYPEPFTGADFNPFVTQKTTTEPTKRTITAREYALAVGAIKPGEEHSNGTDATQSHEIRPENE